MRQLDGLGYKKKEESDIIENKPNIWHRFNVLFKSLVEKIITIFRFKKSEIAPDVFSSNNYRPNLLNKFFLIIIIVLILVYFSINNYGPIKNCYQLFNLFKSGKILVLFQNNSELRPSGGFIGSYAVLDIKWGKINNLEIDTNIYKLDDSFEYMQKINAPDPLQEFLDNKYWTMHDSNWWVDFEDSAKQVAWFYQQESGNSVDGVIAINASVVADVLNMIGSIDMPKYDTKITSNNFFDVLHQEIEKEYYLDSNNQEINEPKTILADMSPKLMEKLQYKNLRKPLWEFTKHEIKEKHIQFYFNNKYLEQIIIWLDWGGKIKKTTNQDYLNINHANLGGMKSSLNIKQDIKLNSFIDDSGVVTNDLIITREHFGDGQWPDNNNNGYMRILVPKGSQLVSANLSKKNITNDIVISNENNKTSYGLWFNTSVGTTKILEVSYQLPFKINKVSDYSLLWQKQSGVIANELNVIINDQVLYDKEIRTDLIIK